MPSSLTRVLPFALVCSTRLPVSVCGTGTRDSSLRGFSWQLGLTTSGSLAPPSPFELRGRIFLPPSSPYRLSTRIQSRAGLPCCVPPSLPSGGSGILTGCPSPTPFGLGLGPTNPTRIDLPSETLDLRRTRFSRVLRYSCRHSHFCTLHRSLQYGFSACRTLPYHLR